ncbi:cytochrome oxidase assembly [Rhizodiscina lignyota]|uniref:Cytochrome oxidase assembly n=1 Tax=Rhizodiscina lignyota TaxID=1504668 RepID=A0A9P4IEU0_9PEZI|nr:cytochrome oxidase assembly [Rhizodiscina lignyota]
MSTIFHLSGPCGQSARRTFFPHSSNKSVAYWLLGSAASVFGIVVFGGLTRLTESGLSITEWRPVTGSFPPVSETDWEAEFAKYRLSPEFKQLNSNMDLAAFKQIYWMEWTHRVWGRVVGITFLLPTIYFIARRRVSAPVAASLVGISGLIGLQGFIGWWMVKSGLKDDLFAKGEVPRVSQYRLTIHLGAAFVVYCSMLYTGLSILRERRFLSMPTVTALEQLNNLASPAFRPFRIATGLLAALIFTTAMSGALVAGLDAGLIYNEFPYMGLGLTPPKAELFDIFYSRKEDRSDLIWRNATANPSLVQLDHRVLAVTTFTAVHALWLWSRFSPRTRTALARIPRGGRGVLGVVHFTWLQVILGISTLIYLVPTWLAASHQAGALALLTMSMVLGSRVWVPRRAMRLVQQAARAQGPSSHFTTTTPSLTAHGIRSA